MLGKHVLHDRVEEEVDSVSWGELVLWDWLGSRPRGERVDEIGEDMDGDDVGDEQEESHREVKEEVGGWG